jgi:enterochelin esterase-like enzyme
MGSSMGGLVSMYAVCEYPRVFRGAGCLSTHWIGDEDAEQHAVSDAFVTYLYESLPDAGGHLFYFDYGTEGLDAYYEPHQQKIDQVMRAKGYQQGKDWVTQKYDGHDHNEKYWRKRIDVPLMFLLENNN